MLDFPTTIVMARHGETWHNVEKVISGGSSNPALNPKGLEDARLLGITLKSTHPDIFEIVFTSDLSRSHETAQIALDQFEGREFTVIPMTEFREIDHGEIDGKMKAFDRSEIWKKFVTDAIEDARAKEETLGPYWKWEHTPFEKEKAETFRHLWNRVSQAIINLSSKEEYQGKKVLILAHNAVIQGLMMQSLIHQGKLQTNEDGLYPMFFEKSLIPNGGVAVFECNPKAENAADRIKYMAPQEEKGK